MMMMMMIMIKKIVMIAKTVERTQWASPATVISIPQGRFGGDDDYNNIGKHVCLWACVRAYKCLSDNSGLPIVTCDRRPWRSRTAHVYETWRPPVAADDYNYSSRDQQRRHWPRLCDRRRQWCRWCQWQQS